MSSFHLHKEERIETSVGMVSCHPDLNVEGSIAPQEPEIIVCMRRNCIGSHSSDKATRVKANEREREREREMKENESSFAATSATYIHVMELFLSS